MQSYKYLLIGDLHVKRDNLDESRRFINWVRALCVEHNLIPIFMGDQANDHGSVRVEVLEFWDWAFTMLAEVTSVYLLIGNHDMNHECKATSMRVYAHIKGVTPIGTEGFDLDGFNMVGFFKKNEDFVEYLKRVSVANPGRLVPVLCHQEVNGVTFENGYYSPYGVDPALIPANILLISGHIHRRQKLMKDGRTVALYVGTPRQATSSEAGDKKFINMVDFSSSLPQFKQVSVPESICEEFKVFDIDPSNAHILKDLPDSPRVLVNVKGPKDFVKQVTGSLPDSVKVRTFPDKERSEVKVKESEGIPKAFITFGQTYFEAKNVSQTVAELALKKVFDKCPSLRGA